MGINILVSYPDDQKTFATELQRQIESWQHAPMGLSISEQRVAAEQIRSADVVVSLVTQAGMESGQLLSHWYLAQINHKWLVQFCVDAVEIPEAFHSDDLLPFNMPLLNKLQHIEQVATRFTGERAMFEKATRQPAQFVPTNAETPVEERLPPVKNDRRWHNLFYVLADFLLILSFLLSLMWLSAELGFGQVATWFEPLLTALGILAPILQAIAWAYQSGLLILGRKQLRQRVLDRVQASWIDGVLYAALEEGREFGIEVTTRPNAIVSRRKLGEIPLPDTRNILTIFETMRERLLILGKPGAGKTIMLLQLAEAMIKKAQDDDSTYLPMVLNLASWGRYEPDMLDWVMTEARRSYGLRPRQTKQLLQRNKLALLLDGLDEVGEVNDHEKRSRCVQAINTFKDAHWIPLVVCSRIDEYKGIQELSQQLQLEGAIQLEPLPRQVVRDHLREKGLAELLKAIDNDHVLYTEKDGYRVTVLDEMSREPFFLNTMAYTYAGQTAEGIGVYPTAFNRRKDLFELYIKRRFREKLHHMDHLKARRYLEWLATKMQVYTQQIVFRPQDIDREWLESESDLPLYNERWQYLSWTVTLTLTATFAWLGWLLNGWWMALLMAGIGYVYARHTLSQAQPDMRGYLNAFGIPSPRHFLLGGRNIPFLIVVLSVIVVGLDMLLARWLGVWAVPVIALLTIPLIQGIARLINTRSNVGINLGVAGVATMAMVFVRLWATTLALNGFVVVLLLGFSFLFLFNAQNAKEPADRWLRPRAWRGVLVFALFMLGSVLAVTVFSLPLVVLALGSLLAVVLGTLTGMWLPVDRFWVWWVIWQHDRLPLLRLNRFLNHMKQAHMLRNMRGGYLFIHRTLRDYLAQDDEIKLWLRRLPDERALRRVIEIGEAAGELTQQMLASATDARVQAAAQLILDRLDEPKDIHERMVARLDSTTWSVGLVAYEWLQGQDWQPVIATERAQVAIWKQAWGECPMGWLAEKMEQLDYSPATIAIGVHLAKVGDPRKGVGLRSDGLPDMVWCDVPAGEFQYGRANQVMHLDAFSIAKYPVTHAQFNVFIRADDVDDPRWWQGFEKYKKQFSKASFPIANHPRESVSWYQAIAFTRWLTVQYHEAGLLEPGELISLPTEWQWEKAARGTDGRSYPWGDDFDVNRCNTLESNLRQTTPVGAYGLGVSPYGCMDMSGNVYEWCLNKYDRPSEVQIDATNVPRVLRGGSFDRPRYDAAAVCRDRDLPFDDLSYRGFRLVVVLRSP